MAQFLWGKDLNISCCGLSFVWDPMTGIFVIFWHISCPFPGEIVNFFEELFLTPGFGSYNGDLWLSSEAKTLITYEVMKASRDPSRLGSLWFIAILCALNAINKILGFRLQAPFFLDQTSLEPAIQSLLVPFSGKMPGYILFMFYTPFHYRTTPWEEAGGSNMHRGLLDVANHGDSRTITSMQFALWQTGIIVLLTIESFKTIHMILFAISVLRCFISCFLLENKHQLNICYRFSIHKFMNLFAWKFIHILE